MKENILGTLNRVENIAPQQSSPNHFTGLIQNKHILVMREAKALLMGASDQTTNIYDNLNCGKLRKLINYLLRDICYVDVSNKLKVYHQ